MKFGVIDSITNKVVNVIEWAGAEWLPPKDTFVVQAVRIDIGDEWNPETEAIIYIDRTGSDPEPEELEALK